MSLQSSQDPATSPTTEKASDPVNVHRRRRKRKPNREPLNDEDVSENLDKKRKKRGKHNDEATSSKAGKKRKQKQKQRDETDSDTELDNGHRRGKRNTTTGNIDAKRKRKRSAKNKEAQKRKTEQPQNGEASILRNVDVVPTVKSRVPSRQCLRIQNVPLSWSKDDLLECLRTADKSLENLDPSTLTLYPACSGPSQTALLNPEQTLMYFQSLLEDNDSVWMPVYDEASGKKLRDLEVDSDFYGLTPLNTPEGEILADIVAVTGLAAHPFGSWRHRQTHSMWLKDFLPQEASCKRVRIFTYGYNTKLVGKGTVDDLFLDYGRNFIQQLNNARGSNKEKVRPIIFIGHSLGGIIILQALVQAKNKQYNKHILDATKAIFFFGTPHTGLQTDELKEMLNDVSGDGEPSSRLKLLGHVGIGSEFLQNLRDGLTEIWDGLKVFSFYENKKTPTVKKDSTTGAWARNGEVMKIVQASSALLNLRHEVQIPLSRNHTEMVKFSSGADSDYRTVVTHMSSCVQEISRLHEVGGVASNVRLSESLGAGTCPKYPVRKIVDLSNEEKECLQSFVYADYSTHRGRIPERHPGTLEWVPEHQAYREWASKDATSMFLWISGNPGCGKTVISAFLLNCLEQAVKSTDERVAYFFCDDKEEKQKSAQSLLRGLIHQLIVATPSLVTHAVVHHIAHGPKILESLDILWNIFISIATDPRTGGAYVILDALDECEKASRDDLLQRLNNHFADSKMTTNGYLKVLITSRPYPEIQRLLHRHPTIRLKTEDEESSITKDIITFISHKVDELDYENSLKEHVRNTLKTNADGMFLWVSLVFAELENTPAYLVSETLSEIPHSLSGLYAHLLKQLPAKTVELTRRILMWVTMAPRPMSVRELAIACSIETSHESMSSVGNALITGFEQDIFRCGPILRVRQGVVHLVHQSAKEFLLNPASHDCGPQFSNLAEQGKFELAITCLTYLSFNDVSDRGLVLPSFPTLAEAPVWEDGLCYFALEYWLQLVQVTDGNGLEIWKAFYRLVRSEERLSLVFHNAVPYDRHSEETHGLCNSLQVSAYLGILSFVERLLDLGNNVNTQSGIYGNPLQAAAVRGHDSVILLLLEHGADVNIQGGKHGSPLQAAAAHGHESVVLLLLQHGADVNIEGGYYGSPLYRAAEGSHDSVVLLLLQHGADVNIQGGRYGSPLQAAAAGDHESVVLLLVQHGADVNIQGGYYGGPLQAAAAGDHHSVVLLLLQHGADVNIQSGEHGSPLQAAAERGHKSVVLLLLQHGADVNIQGGEHGSPLYMAAEGGHYSVLLLLQHGADANIQGGEHGSPLQAAAACGHESVVLLLLQHGADVNIQGGRYGSPLQAAAARGHKSVVLLLLQHGADVNIQGGEHGSPLYMAGEGGHYSVLLLLQHGADVNIQGEYYGSPLYRAAACGHASVVLLLLQHGADVNIQGEYYGSPLQAAAARGHKSVVLLLLEHGMDVNIQGGEHGSPLYMAAAYGHESVVLLLLQHGADANIQGEYYGSPLYRAAACGHDSVVLLLLQHGADVNIQSGEHGSPLQAAAARGHESVVLLLLQHGADVNIQGGRYGSPLQAAAARGHKSVVLLLLQHGADVNIQGGEHGSPLYMAGEGGHYSVLLLLQHGADVNIQGEYYGSPLYRAAACGHASVVLLLLQHGADVNIQGGRYGSPLQAAAARGHDSVILLLLQHGADVNIQGGYYGGPLQAAAACGHDSVVLLLLQHGADVNIQGGRYGSPLQAAAEDGHKSVVLLLLQHGADANIQGGKHGNPLQAAAVHGYDSVFLLLLEHGADVNIQGGRYGGPLQAAAARGHVSVVLLLLGHGVDVNIQGGEHGSPLQAAAAGGHESVVLLLLQHGADIKARGKSGTALHLAKKYMGLTRKRGQATVSLLCDHGALDSGPDPDFGSDTNRAAPLTLISNHQLN